MKKSHLFLFDKDACILVDKALMYFNIFSTL